MEYLYKKGIRIMQRLQILQTNQICQHVGHENGKIVLKSLILVNSNIICVLTTSDHFPTVMFWADDALERRYKIQMAKSQANKSDKISNINKFPYKIRIW